MVIVNDYPSLGTDLITVAFLGLSLWLPQRKIEALRSIILQIR